MPPPEFFTGRKPSVQQVPTRSKQQIQGMDQLVANLLPQVQQSFDFGPIAQAATSRFEQQTMPGIEERFGGANAKRSSGYNQSIANAMENLQTQLAGQQSQFGLQSQANMGNLLNLGMGQQFENVMDEGSESPFGAMLAQLLPLLLHGGAAFATSGASIPASAAMYGGQIGGDSLMPLMKMFGFKG